MSNHSDSVGSPVCVWGGGGGWVCGCVGVCVGVWVCVGGCVGVWVCACVHGQATATFPFILNSHN